MNRKGTKLSMVSSFGRTVKLYEFVESCHSTAASQREQEGAVCGQHLSLQPGRGACRPDRLNMHTFPTPLPPLCTVLTGDAIGRGCFNKTFEKDRHKLDY